MNCSYRSSVRLKASVQEQGFTLLEILVVLVLISLIVGLLMQGLSHVLRLRIQFVGQAEQQQTEMLQEKWFRSLVGGIIPTQLENPDQFQGKQTTLAGFTLASLELNAGVPAPLNISLVNNGDLLELRYRTLSEEDWVLAHWRSAKAWFEYLDREGNWHKQWPPVFGVYEQLPVAVKLVVDKPPRSIHLFALVHGRKVPRVDPTNPF